MKKSILKFVGQLRGQKIIEIQNLMRNQRIEYSSLEIIHEKYIDEIRNIEEIK